MRLNSSAPGSRGADPFPLPPPSGLDEALLAPNFRNGSGNASEPAGASSISDLDVDTDVYSKVLVTVVYLALFVVGTVGNAVTAFTLARKKSLQSLQSAVHYHLGSLALSDLLTLLLAMPVELYNFIWVHHPWAFGDAGCRGYYFLRDACTYATALNVASLSVERYLAICHPFKAKTLMSRSRTKKLISAIWVAAGLLAVPMLFVMGQQNRSTDGQNPSGLVCTPVVSAPAIKVVIQVSSLFFAGGGLGRNWGLTWGASSGKAPCASFLHPKSHSCVCTPRLMTPGKRMREGWGAACPPSWSPFTPGRPGLSPRPIPNFCHRVWEPRVTASPGHQRPCVWPLLKRVPFVGLLHEHLSQEAGSVCLQQVPPNPGCPAPPALGRQLSLVLGLASVSLPEPQPQQAEGWRDSSGSSGRFPRPEKLGELS